MRAFNGISLSAAWIDAYEYVAGMRKGKAVNVVVTFSTISEDVGVREVVDNALAATATRRKEPMFSIETVANTLFPESWYVPDRAPKPREHLYWCREQAAKVHRRLASEPETYFDRLVAYPGPTGEINQLEMQVNRLVTQLGTGGPMSSAYEIGLSIPGELRTQVPGRDRRYMGFPCLSHISLSLHEGAIHLTATYRNQGFFRKAYGNYVGLARLARFLAREVGVDVGEITCIASHADAELSAIGGVRAARHLVEECRAAADAAGVLEEVDVAS